MPAVITLGELLIDFVSTRAGVSLEEAPAFEKAAGGAPANVAVGTARLGVTSAFLGKVGEDAFGRFLARTLKENGVDISGLCFSREARTMLAFVSLQASGERDFEFYRSPSADILYTPEEVHTALLQQARVFHFGSISLISEPSRSATLYAVETARQAGALISYDPTLRLNLWADEHAAREGIRLGWPLAHVIKVSEEELAFLSGMEDITQGAQALWHPELKLLVVTRGKDGCAYFTPDFNGEIPGFPVHAVDTTGAGDGFVAGMLAGLSEQLLASLDQTRLHEILRFANAVGALTTTRRGAIPALPRRQEVEAFLAQAG